VKKKKKVPILKALNEDLPQEYLNDVGFLLFVSDLDA